MNASSSKTFNGCQYSDASRGNSLVVFSFLSEKSCFT
jgi:hypothetical protein